MDDELESIELTRELALKYVSKCEPIFWIKQNLNVVRDGHHSITGIRIHFVKESGYNGQIIDNAMIFSETINH